MDIQSTLKQLETILVWEGQVDNERIRKGFGVKAVWASRLMSELMQYMGNRARRATPHAPLKFVGKKIASTPDDYLRIVGSSELIEDARLDFSEVQPQVFAMAIQAIRNGTGLQLFYRSMNNPNGSERIIYPHTLVRVARRWHLRAWCDLRREFRDFTLGRCREVCEVDEPSPMSRSDDRDWNEHEEVWVVAHPDLTPEQQAMIRDEYFNGAEGKSLVARKCLVEYVLRDLHIAVDATQQRPPEYQLLKSSGK